MKRYLATFAQSFRAGLRAPWRHPAVLIGYALWMAFAHARWWNA